VQFDTAVNMGVGRAVRFLQAAVGCGVDGKFGSGTAQAVANCNPRSALAASPDLKVFLNGWLREVGLTVFGFAEPPNPFEAGPMMRIPDLGEDPKFDI
jgi:hypothetical protein